MAVQILGMSNVISEYHGHINDLIGIIYVKRLCKTERGIRFVFKISFIGFNKELLRCINIDKKLTCPDTIIMIIRIGRTYVSKKDGGQRLIIS